ncbi:YusG family protein [Bacillus timonensis]|nr:YusG family protein [Bacillus timonensis]
MVLENKRLDITDRVVGKLCESGMDLYVEEEPIGKFITSEEGNRFELKNGYEQDQYRIFKYADVTVGPDAKYVDCDYENGWC